MNDNGVVIWEGPSPVDGRTIVLIATGITDPSDNVKTGDMIQTWILVVDEAPHILVKEGRDDAVCGTCPFRAGDGCYVTVFQAPLSVWKAYQRGSYRKMTPSQAGILFAGRQVRLGAYGDPGLVPLSVLRAIVKHAEGWTGYTHQWSSIDRRYASLLMASVESAETQAKAKARGYRTFYVVRPDDDVPEGRFMLCSAERERNPLSCAECGACAGTRNGAVSGAVDVYILAHGSRVGRMTVDA